MSSLVTRHSLFDDFFKDIGTGFFVKPLHGDPLPDPSRIKMDVKETDKDFTVSAEIPGVSKDDIHVSVDGNVVTVSTEIKQEDAQVKDERLLKSERYFGAMSRSVGLPVTVDKSKASAKYDKGVLTLVLPKEISSGTSRLKVE
jgi:HSP20 family protein